MKKVTYVKLALDLIIGVTFALFYNKNVLGGISFHEIAGLVICGAFLVHVLLNGKWVKTVTLKLFDRKLPGKTRLSYLLNLLLLITMTIIIVTGIFISRVVFPNLNIGNEQWFKMLHLSVSYITLILVAVHVGLHWQWVMNMFKKIFKIKSSSKVMSYTAKAATVFMLLFGGYEIYATGFGTRIVQSSNIFTSSSQQGQIGSEGFARGQVSENGQPPAGFTGEKPTMANGERPTPPNGDFKGGSGDFQGNGEMPTRPDRGVKGEHGEGSNAISVIINYFGIMSVFIILTYYLGKIKRRKNKPGMAV